MRIIKYLTAVILSCAAFHSALAQPSGTYSVTESWSVTFYNDLSGLHKTFTGTESGSLTITNGDYILINHSGAPNIPSLSRTIFYDGSNYTIEGDYPVIGFGGARDGFYAFIRLTYFVIAIKVPATVVGPA